MRHSHEIRKTCLFIAHSPIHNDSPSLARDSVDDRKLGIKQEGSSRSFDGEKNTLTKPETDYYAFTSSEKSNGKTHIETCHQGKKRHSKDMLDSRYTAY